MEHTMTDGTHQPIGFSGALARQFRLLWTSRRPALLAVALLAVLVLAGSPWSDDVLARLLNPWPVWVLAVGPIWAFAVFHNEGPSARLYHWSLPVDRTHHTLARLVAGLLWLWLLYALLVAVGAVMATLDGNVSQFGEVGVNGWVNLFTGPTLGYLGISILTVASDYPLRWFFGIVFAVPFLLSILDQWLGLEAFVETLLRPLSEEEWGLFPVMVGELAEPVMRLNARLHGVAGDPPHFDVVYWWPATIAWLAVLAGLVWLIASRHPDTLPRFRRRG